MNSEDKRRFVRELIENVTADILAKVNKMPDDWDGIELRQFIADRFADASFTWSEQTRKRHAGHRNECLVRNL